MAKFKVGDKVVWLHFHSDSLSNETIKEVWKDGTYLVDSGLANERELYPGRVAKEAEGVTGMRDIGGGRFSTPHFPNKWFDLNGRVGSNSRACNSIRSRNAVVAKALNACARNAGGTARNGVFEKADDAKLKELGKRLLRAYEAWATKDDMWENAEREWATLVRICKEARRYGNLFFSPNAGGFIVRPVPRLPYASLFTEDLTPPPKYRKIKIPSGPNKGKIGWTCSPNACGTARNATFGSVEDAERYSEQAVKAAKSRVFSEMNTLKDVVRALKGYPDSKTVQKNLVTLEWALEEIKKAAQTLS